MTNKTYLINVGVDISKLKLDVALSDQQAASFDNNQKGFECFLKALKNQSETRVVMEATGGYEKPLARFLHSQGIAVSIVNAKRVRDYAKAFSSRRVSLLLNLMTLGAIRFQRYKSGNCE